MTINKRTLSTTLHSMLIAIACIAFAACSSQRGNNVPTATQSGTNKAGAPNISELANAYHGWTTFYAPFSIRTTQPVSFSFSGRATMEYGKAISLSLRMLGMEVGVAYIDSDSAIVVDKFHKYYIAVPLSSVTAKTSITISDIQSILLGQAIYPGEGPISNAKKIKDLFSSAEDGDNLILTPRRSSKGATWYMTLGAGPILRKVTVEPTGMSPFNAVFSDIISSVAGPVAADINISGSISKKDLRAEIEWNMNKAEWNSDRTVSKPSYAGYKKLDVTDFLKSIHN